jgi:DNA-binding NarL/FixJ family response regulator
MAGGVAYDGPVELALGIGRARLGDVAGAVDELEVAVIRAEAAGSPGFVAEAQFHLAAALAGRDPAAARPLAEAAGRTVRALGMTAYEHPIAELLGRLGAAAQTKTLTAREDEVALMVADGLANRQIAQRLVISERTAQNHVQHILTKLQFTSRAQIAAWVSARRNE